MKTFSEHFWHLYRVKNPPHQLASYPNAAQTLKWGGYLIDDSGGYELSPAACQILEEASSKELEELDIDWQYLQNFIQIFIKTWLRQYTPNDPWFREWEAFQILEIKNDRPGITDRGKELLSQFFVQNPDFVLRLLKESYRLSNDYQKALVKSILKTEWPVLLSKLNPEEANFYANLIRNI